MKDLLNNVRRLQEQNDPRYQADMAAHSAPAQGVGSGQSQEFDIAGEKIVLHDPSPSQPDLTDAEKNTFEQSIDQFRKEVSDMVEFNSLHIYPNDLKWSGKLIKFDLEFFYVLGAKNGVYLKGEMMKVDEEFTKLIQQLSAYHQTFTTNWTPILTDRRELSKGTNV